MKSFLEQTATYVFEHHRINLDKVCLVAPNRRAALYLRKYLARLIEQPIWLPEMVTVEDFVIKFSGYSLADPLTLLFELHAVHQTIEGENAQPFERFMQWGQMLLSDFNEIDLYMADHAQLYTYLSDEKAIELWNPSGEPLTEFEKSYLSFFSSMKRYYEELHDYLDGEKMAWQGMAYRKLAVENAWMDQLPYEKIYFIGFNALTKAEEVMTTRLERMGKAEMLWDSDTYYVENPVHEAGRFLRQFMKKEKGGELHWKGNYFAELPHRITVRGVPNKVSQAKEAGKLIAKLLEQNSDLTGTALVLADETMLLPVLNAIPEASGDFNVTMGFSLTYTPLYSLIDGIFAMHATSRQFSQGKPEPGFWVKEVLRLLMHPYMARMAGGYTQTNRIAATLRDSKIPFQKAAMICDSIREQKGLSNTNAPELMELLLDSSWHTTRGALESLTLLTDRLKQSFTPAKTSKENDTKRSTGDLPIEQEYFFVFARLIQRLKKMHSRYEALNNTETLHQIVLQLMKLEKIPFYGEPLKGVQIMGMLETRTLDFDRVILLGANDDLLPGARKHDSFIPYNIKTEFGIPIHTDKDAVMAYHFYRLLQRAGEAWMFYNTEPNNMGGGDKSRFILQLREELQKANPASIVDLDILTLPTAGKPDLQGIGIQKSDEIFALLEKKAVSGFSPTSLSRYVNCSLQFYFSEILKIEETEEIEETIDARVMGSVIHEVLHYFYAQHLNEIITPELISLMIKQVPEKTKEAFKANKDFKGSFSEGKNLLIVKVAQLYITNYLKKERAVIQKNKLPLVIRKLEQGFDYQLVLQDPSHETGLRTVKIKGFIDRIDQMGETLRLIDYKTGNVEAATDLKLKDAEALLTDPGKAKALQLLIYQYLIEKNPQQLACTYDKIEPGIISLRKVGNYLMPLEAEDAWPTAGGFADFEALLSELLEAIFDRDIPFSATTDQDRCRYCSFKTICNR